jgi:hypothetical protein
VTAGYTDARQRTTRTTTHRSAQHPSHRPPPSSRSRWWPTLLLGLLCWASSFVITWQFIKPRPPARAAAALAHAFVSDSRSLISAIKTAGLKGSHNIRGAIEAITAVGHNRVSVTGWAGELDGREGPLDVLVFVDGENKLTIRTADTPFDLSSTVGSDEGGPAHNATFQGSLVCAHGQKLIAVAVAESGDYGYFNPRVCP